MPSPANLFLVAVLVVWVLTRQLRTAPVKHRLLVLVPLVLAYVGLQQLPDAGLHHPVDVALVVASAAGSVALGWWRGLSLEVWRTDDGVWMRRGTRTTLALWAAVFALRGVAALVAVLTGHPHSTGASVMLCCLASSLAAQNAVTLTRTLSARPVPSVAPTA